MTDKYAAAGYSSITIGPGTRPAVLVVDLQTGFTDPKFPLGSHLMVHAATEKTAALLKVARAKGVPVASCYTAYCSPDDMPYWKVKAVREEFYYGHPCTAIDPRIHDPSDYIFVKSAPSIFFQTPLVAFLTKQRVDTVIVTGCNTSGCVRASIVDAFSWGYRVMVPEDCCGDADRAPHDANLLDVGRRYADITDAAAMTRYLESLEAQ